MRIKSITNQCVTKLDYYSAATGTEGGISENFLPVYSGVIEGLTPNLDALIVCSDLQGFVVENNKEVLLGEYLPEFISSILESFIPHVNKDKTGVLLPGDYFADLNYRGGIGDVRKVWLRFKYFYKWVMGISGNHDSYGNNEEFRDFVNSQGIIYLKENIVNLENHKWSGINGIIGRPDKTNRIDENDYYLTLKKILNKHPDVILLHQVPSFPEFNLKGNDGIRSIIDKVFPVLYFCGHVEWRDNFFIEMSNGSQVLNVDNKVFILVNSTIC